MLSAPEHTVHNIMLLGVSLYLNPMAWNNKRKNKLGERNKETASEIKDSTRMSKKTQTWPFSSVCMYVPQQSIKKATLIQIWARVLQVPKNTCKSKHTYFIIWNKINCKLNRCMLHYPSCILQSNHWLTKLWGFDRDIFSECSGLSLVRSI